MLVEITMATVDSQVFLACNARHISNCAECERSTSHAPQNLMIPRTRMRSVAILSYISTVAIPQRYIRRLELDAGEAENERACVRGCSYF
jgi:hypothetical protein